MTTGQPSHQESSTRRRCAASYTCVRTTCPPTNYRTEANERHIRLSATDRHKWYTASAVHSVGVTCTLLQPKHHLPSRGKEHRNLTMSVMSGSGRCNAHKLASKNHCISEPQPMQSITAATNCCHHLLLLLLLLLLRATTKAATAYLLALHQHTCTYNITFTCSEPSAAPNASTFTHYIRTY